MRIYGLPVPLLASAVSAAGMQGILKQCCLIAAFCFRPVYGLKPGFDIVGTQIPVLQVIGVFPEIQVEDWTLGKVRLEA